MGEDSGASETARALAREVGQLTVAVVTLAAKTETMAARIDGLAARVDAVVLELEGVRRELRRRETAPPR